MKCADVYEAIRIILERREGHDGYCKVTERTNTKKKRGVSDKLLEGAERDLDRFEVLGEELLE
jgi:hypothetical protein